MRTEIVVIGAGGHAKVCIELLRGMQEDVAFCISAAGSSEYCLGVPVLQGDQHLKSLAQQGFSRVFIAIGDNFLRSRLGDEVAAMGWRLANAISPTAVLSPSAKIGSGVAIMAGAIINADVVVNDLAIINTGAVVDHDCIVGRAAHVAPQSGLAGCVSIGDRAFVGVGSAVIPGARVGDGAVVGAGGVVIHDVPDNSVAVGVPVRVVKNR